MTSGESEMVYSAGVIVYGDGVGYGGDVWCMVNDGDVLVYDGDGDMVVMVMCCGVW